MLGPPGPMLGHGGDIPGFTSVMYYDPKRKLTLIVWTTLNFGPDGRVPVDEMAKVIIRELYNESATR